MPMVMKWSESEQDAEIQYGEYLFSEIGSIFNSAVYWPIASNFGAHIDFNLY